MLSFLKNFEMRNKIRLLPTVIVFTLILMVSKIFSVGQDATQVFSTPTAGAAETQDVAAQAEPDHAEGSEGASDEAAQAAQAAQAAEESGTEASEGAEMQVADASTAVSDEPTRMEQGLMNGFTPDPVMSVSERQLLQNLSARRAELEKREKEIQLQASLLQATEQRIEKRVKELKALQAKIESYFGEEEQQKEDQIGRLVEIYSTMKPKKAARILERLDLGVLLKVASAMNERKLAPILAVMDPVAAQELTVELAALAEFPPELQALQGLSSSN